LELIKGSKMIISFKMIANIRNGLCFPQIFPRKH
jgi:hypothetical protein